jgi:exonuclease VII small subunit
MSHRPRDREVEIFNFSFLDILACTIGLLIFIMVMVFILQSSGPVADSSALIERKLSEASQAREVATHDSQITDALEASLDRVQVPDEPDLKPERDAARDARDAAQAHYDQATRELTAAQSSLDEARLALDRSVARSLDRANADLAAAQAAHRTAESELTDARQAANTNSVILSPYRRPGQPDEVFNILHVDCRADVVILLKVKNGKIIEVGRTASNNIKNPQSDFLRIVLEHRLLDHALVLFWIRPDGYATYAAAVENLPESTEYGFEPADSDWSIQSAR